MMPAGRVFSPLLLLLLGGTLPTLVQGQEVDVSLVSTYYVEVTWARTELWLGVEDYNVRFTAEGSKDCSKTIHCSDVICTFNSLLYCGVVSACTTTTTTVSGGGHSASPITLVTGPEKVTNIATRIEEGVGYISWVNPSMDSSPCYEETAVRLFFNGEDSISYFNYSQGSASRGLSEEGCGTVVVWTEGGDGRSNSSSETIAYIGSEVVDMVTFETCEPVACTSLYVEWSYTPVCPDVEYISVRAGDVWQNASTNTNSTTVEGLEVEEDYNTCINAMNKDGRILQNSCKNYCSTPSQVPRNLRVEALSSSSLHFTWDPPVCQKPPVVYKLYIYYDYYTTTETEYTVDDLMTFYEYYTTLQVDGRYHDTDEMARVTAYTLPDSPDSLYTRWSGDQVHASWYFYTSYHWGFTFYFKVTWGKSLQHEEKTRNQYIWIKEYNSTDEVHQVCVAAYPLGREDLMSDTICQYVSDSGDSGTGSELSGWAIALIVLGPLAVIAVGVFCAAVHHSKSRAQQRQQQQQQNLSPYNYGVTNPAANT